MFRTSPMPSCDPIEGVELRLHNSIQEWGQDVPVFLNIMQIGDIAMCGFPGEMFNAVGKYVIDHSPVENTLFVNHCWTREGENGNYYADDFTLENGGPKAEQSFHRPGYINDTMSELANRLLEEISENEAD